MKFDSPYDLIFEDYSFDMNDWREPEEAAGWVCSVKNGKIYYYHIEQCNPFGGHMFESAKNIERVTLLISSYFFQKEEGFPDEEQVITLKDIVALLYDIDTLQNTNYQPYIEYWLDVMFDLMDRKTAETTREEWNTKLIHKYGGIIGR